MIGVVDHWDGGGGGALISHNIPGCCLDETSFRSTFNCRCIILRTLAFSDVNNMF